MHRTLIVFIGTATAGFVCARQSNVPEEGAKALFADVLNNKLEMASKPPPVTSHVSRPSHASRTKAPSVTGLMYYVELLRPDGELLRVNSDRIFHTGERIRLHLTSAVNGNLVIYQSEDGSKPQLLFPSGKLSGHIEKGIDVALPSPHAWFVFDNHPGRINLSLKLTADGSEENVPALAQDSPALLAAAAHVHKLNAAESGSKALKIETDDSPDGASRWVVMDSRRDPNVVPGHLTAEVWLEHHS